MKRTTNLVVIATLVLGIGTITNASANQSSIEDSLSKAIVQQGQQVSIQLAKQVKQSISSSLQTMSTAVIKSVQTDNKKQLVQVNNEKNQKSSSTEEE